MSGGYKVSAGEVAGSLLERRENVWLVGYSEGMLSRIGEGTFWSISSFFWAKGRIFL